MNQDASIDKIILLLKDVLRTNKINLESEMGYPPEWNSLSHVEVIIKLEMEFNCKIELHHLPILTSVKKIDEYLRLNQSAHQ